MTLKLLAVGKVKIGWVTFGFKKQGTSSGAADVFNLAIKWWNAPMTTTDRKVSKNIKIKKVKYSSSEMHALQKI